MTKKKRVARPGDATVTTVPWVPDPFVLWLLPNELPIQVPFQGEIAPASELFFSEISSFILGAIRTHPEWPRLGLLQIAARTDFPQSGIPTPALSPVLEGVTRCLGQAFAEQAGEYSFVSDFGSCHFNISFLAVPTALAPFVDRKTTASEAALSACSKRQKGS